MRRSIVPWLGVMLLLGGCVAGPSYPLLSPQAATGGFGYAETPRGGDNWSVFYLTPVRYAGYAGFAPRPDAVEGTRSLALDMATWRAAELASAQGFPGFKITDRRADVTVYADPLDTPFYFPRPYWDGWNRPFPAAGPYWWPDTPRLLASAQATIEITLERALRPGDVVAQDTINQLRQRYPGAEGGLPPVAPATAPTPAPAPAAPAK